MLKIDEKDKKHQIGSKRNSFGQKRMSHYGKYRKL